MLPMEVDWRHKSCEKIFREDRKRYRLADFLINQMENDKSAAGSSGLTNRRRYLLFKSGGFLSASSPSEIYETLRGNYTAHRCFAGFMCKASEALNFQFIRSR